MARKVALLLCPAPAALAAKMLEGGVLQNEQGKNAINLRSGLVIVRHRLHPIVISNARAVVRPVEIVEEYPSAGHQQFLDEKERESVRLPGMGSVDKAEVEAGDRYVATRLALDHIFQLPRVGGFGEKRRHKRAQSGPFQERKDIRFAFARRRVIDGDNAAVALFLERRRHVAGRGAVRKSQFENPPAARRQNKFIEDLSVLRAHERN